MERIGIDDCKCRASFLRALLLGLALCTVQSAWGEENQATIAAMEALLSMPETQPPEGGWEHRAPPGFEADGNADEATLISWLRKQKKLGADLNAVRHGGTMLHHVVRAGMADTAAWLLANGADPAKEGEHDALELALAYRQDGIFRLLIKHPAVLDPNRHGLYLAWKAVLDNEHKAELQKLVDARVPLPAGKYGEALLDDALRAGNVRLVRALTDTDPNLALRARGRSMDEDIETADRRLSQPIFLALIDKAASADEVDRLFRLRIRRPFDDPAFAIDAVRKALWKGVLGEAPTPLLAGRAFDRMPASALRLAFKDENVLSMWWRWLSHLPAKERAAAMARWGDLPTRQPEALLKAATKGSYWFDQNEKDPNAANAWAELLAALRAPLPEAMQGKLWMFVPQMHRLTLLQLGYRPSSEELRWWIERNSPELIRSFWPKMLAIRPEIGRRSHELLFRPIDGGAAYCIDQWTIDKTLPLTADAMPPATAYVMEAACWYATPEKVRQTLLSRGWVRPPLPVVGRIVREEAQCRFRPTAAWRKALAGLRSLDADGTPIDAVIAASVPGQQDCVLLAWGGSAGGRAFIDDDSFEGTQRLTPCTDGNYAVAILRLKGEALDFLWQKDVPFPGGMTPIRDTGDGKRYWLGGNEGLGTCGQTAPALFRFEAAEGQSAVLKALPSSHPAMQALMSQCQRKELQECLLGHPPADPDSGARAYPEQTAGLALFADIHWSAERKAFVDAVLDFRPDVLSAMKTEGVFPHWVTEALSAVSASSMPLAEKRRRIAWLFRDHALLRAALSSQMLDGLVDWLPPEDWGPIIKEGPGRLGGLLYSAQTKGKKRLACRFATALKQPCGQKEE